MLMLVQGMGKSKSEQMIALLVEEVVEAVDVGEGAEAEAVEVKAVKDVGVVESVSEIN